MMTNPDEEGQLFTFSATVEVTGDVSIRAASRDEAEEIFENDPMTYLSVEYTTVIEYYEEDEDNE